MPPSIPCSWQRPTRGVADHACVPRETNSPFLGVGRIPAISDRVQAHKPCISINTLSWATVLLLFCLISHRAAISSTTAWQSFTRKSFLWKPPKKQGTRGEGASGVFLLTLWCCSENRNTQWEGWKQARHSLRTPPCTLLSAAGSAHPFTRWHIVNLTCLLQRTLTLSLSHKMGQKQPGSTK